MKKLTGTLVYVNVHKPTKSFRKEGQPIKPNEWKASVVLTDEDTVDEFEDYAKSLDAKVSLKKVKSAEFEEIYKCDLPKDAGKNVWVITLRKSTELGKTGKPVPELYHPKVYEQTEEDGKIVRQDITKSKIVGNGSFGNISIDVFTRDNGTSSLYLKNILVTKLIEYIPEEGEAYNPGSEFDDDEEDEQTPSKPAAKTPAAKKTAPKNAAKDDDEDPPF